MMKNGTYADYIVICEMAKFTQVTITVHEEAGYHTCGTENPTLNIGFVPQISHFVSLKPQFINSLRLEKENIMQFIIPIHYLSTLVA